MGDIDDFDLDRTIDEGWQQFGVRLGEVLSVMDDGAELTLSTREGGAAPPRVVFRSPELGTIRAEVLGFGPEDRDGLTAAGWPASHPVATWSQDLSDDLAGVVVRTLRDVFGVTHPVFLSTDDLAGLLEPPAPQEEWSAGVAPVDPTDTVAVLARDKDELDRLVARQLTKMFGHEPVRDSDGDHTIRVGSTMVFVRVAPDAREITVFSALVHDVSGRSRATEVLNDLNAESRWVRFALLRDRVFGSMSVLARPFVPAHLHQAVTELAQVADGIDENLADTLRGRTTFSA